MSLLLCIGDPRLRRQQVHPELRMLRGPRLHRELCLRGESVLDDQLRRWVQALRKPVHPIRGLLQRLGLLWKSRL
jgi:hypothetical protein